MLNDLYPFRSTHLGASDSNSSKAGAVWTIRSASSMPHQARGMQANTVLNIPRKLHTKPCQYLGPNSPQEQRQEKKRGALATEPHAHHAGWPPARFAPHPACEVTAVRAVTGWQARGGRKGQESYRSGRIDARQVVGIR